MKKEAQFKNGGLLNFRSQRFSEYNVLAIIGHSRKLFINLGVELFENLFMGEFMGGEGSSTLDPQNLNPNPELNPRSNLNPS